MWLVANLVNRRVFKELGKSETDWGEFSRLKMCKMEWALRKREEKYKKETVERKKIKKQKERRGDSLDPGLSGPSHLKGIP